MIVVDAAVLAPALADDEVDGDRARQAIEDEWLCAPELVDLEVVSFFRRALRAKQLNQGRAAQALEDLAELPLARSPHGPLVSRAWELRDNLTPYDAAYVALAEALAVPLLTADRALSEAPGIRCQVNLLNQSG